MSAGVNPDCRDGKHRACRGDAWDLEADAAVACACSCHRPWRVLSVRQPWAWAIVHGGKDVENRSRSLGPYRGPVAIHASTTYPSAAEMHRLRAGSDALARALGAFEQDHPQHELYPYASLPWMNLGHIIGVVDLVGEHTSRTEYREARHYGPGILENDPCSPWAEPGAMHLVLANPRPLSEPIPFKGGLGLRTLPADVQAEVQRRLT